MKLSDYFNYLASLTETFIPSDYSTKDYLKEYFDNAITYDTQTQQNFSSLLLLNDDFSITKKLIMASVVANDYKWKKLYETTVLTYNPIWNVDGTETRTMQYGEHVTTQNNGERIETMVNGERQNTSNQKLSSYPFDTGTKTATEETDESVINAQSTDTRTNNAVVDSTTSNTHTDTETLTRSGNIGVTSTQKLINEERQVAMFQFINSVLLDIVTDITIPVWEESEEDDGYCIL